MRFIDPSKRVCLLNIGDSEEDVTDFGANHNGLSLTLNQLEDDEYLILASLAAASHLLYSVSDKARNSKDLDPRIKDYLALLGPAMESFVNSQTMRDGGREFYEFDYGLSNKLPNLQT